MSELAQKPLKAFLLAAGLGTRLRPLTDVTPKCLLPINGKPLLELWLQSLERTGVDEVLINTHWLPKKVEQFLAERPPSKMKICTSFEPVLLGSAGTLYQHRGWGGNSRAVLILYADNLTNVDLGTVLTLHQGHSYPLSLGTFIAPDPTRCGILQVDSQGVVLDFVEKPKSPKSNLAAGGIYVANPVFFQELRHAGHEPFDLGHHVFPEWINRMAAIPLHGYVLDIGTMKSYAEAQERFLHPEAK